MFTEHHNGIAIHRFSIFRGVPGLVCGFSGRTGGVSTGGYASLNLGLHVGDAPHCVLENRRRLCGAAGIDAQRLVIGEQVHAGVVRIVCAADAGRGATGHGSSVNGADGLVTAEPLLPLMALSADCPLVVLHDAQARVLGVVHASWRSAAAGIVGAAVDAMASLGGTPARMRAAVAPCVGKCCYEVRDDFIEIIVHSAIGTAERYIERREGRTFFDVRAAVAGLLRASGLAECSIEAAEACTACTTGAFYSHRACGGAQGGKTGRFALFAEMCGDPRTGNQSTEP